MHCLLISGFLLCGVNNFIFFCFSIYAFVFFEIFYIQHYNGVKSIRNVLGIIKRTSIHRKWLYGDERVNAIVNRGKCKQRIFYMRLMLYFVREYNIFRVCAISLIYLPKYNVRTQ